LVIRKEAHPMTTSTTANSVVDDATRVLFDALAVTDQQDVMLKGHRVELIADIYKSILSLSDNETPEGAISWVASMIRHRFRTGYRLLAPPMVGLADVA
jgi:hypothetical protein